MGMTTIGGRWRLSRGLECAQVPFLLVAFLLLTSRGRGGALTVELIGRLAPHELAGRQDERSLPLGRR